MRVLETVYRGHRFRSRAEARWAVFFENLSIEYEYEPEGFDLGFGCLYLPDFYLPGLEVYFEVKGREPSREEQRKAELLSSAAQIPVLIAWGQIGYRDDPRHPIRFTQHEISAHLGHVNDLWTSKLLHPSWEYRFSDKALGEFISQKFPDERLPGHDDELSRRRKLVELDQVYYRSRHGVEHPCYTSGRTNPVAWHWVNGSPCLRPTHETATAQIARAYDAARAARFEHAGASE